MMDEQHIYNKHVLLHAIQENAAYAPVMTISNVLIYYQKSTKI